MYPGRFPPSASARVNEVDSIYANISRLILGQASKLASTPHMHQKRRQRYRRSKLNWQAEISPRDLVGLNHRLIEKEKEEKVEIGSACWRVITREIEKSIATT
jgi:hypothetical protein